jgi:hypothetical protein
VEKLYISSNLRFSSNISHFVAISQNLDGMGSESGCDLGGGEGQAMILCKISDANQYSPFVLL